MEFDNIQKFQARQGMMGEGAHNLDKDMTKKKPLITSSLLEMNSNLTNHLTDTNVNFVDT